MNCQSVVNSQPSHRHRRWRVSEMAGGTAAECAAVACCPCAVLNLVFLALYTVPVGLFKKAAHKRRRRLMKSNVVGNKKNDVVIFQPQRSSSVDPGPTGLEEYLETEHPAAADKSEDVALEKEMWARFAGTGFWRSESQREP